MKPDSVNGRVTFSGCFPANAVSKARNALFCWRSNEHAYLTLWLCTEGLRAAIGPFSSGLPFGSFRS